jgi:hypothetical protein
MIPEKRSRLRRQKEGRKMPKKNDGKQDCGPYELVVETATARISFGKFAVPEARTGGSNQSSSAGGSGDRTLA